MGCLRGTLQSPATVLMLTGSDRRKMHGRNETITDPIIVNSAIIDALQTYVETGSDEVACVTAKFLDAFMHHASLVESFEVDNFVLRNGSSLCTWYVSPLKIITPIVTADM